MSENTTPQRPAVMESMSETQLQDLEFQASEYDEKEFLEIAGAYG